MVADAHSIRPGAIIPLTALIPRNVRPCEVHMPSRAIGREPPTFFAPIRPGLLQHHIAALVPRLDQRVSAGGGREPNVNASPVVLGAGKLRGAGGGERTAAAPGLVVLHRVFGGRFPFAGGRWQQNQEQERKEKILAHTPQACGAARVQLRVLQDYVQPRFKRSPNFAG